MIEPKIEISDEMSANYFAACEGIRLRDLGSPERYVLETFLQLSFLIGKKEARVTSLQKLADAAYLHKGNLRRYIDSLIRAEIVSERYEDGHFYYEVRPDWEQWRVPRRQTHNEQATAEQALRWLREAPDPNQLELIERPADFDAEISRAFASSRPRSEPARQIPDVQSRESAVLPAESFATSGECKAALNGFEEQMERLERIVPEARTHRMWWRKHGGQDAQRLKAMRQTLDDFTTNRVAVRVPIAWIISTFKSKVRALVATE